MIAAVADGAGSADLGEVGAAIAARAAVERIRASETRPPLPVDDAAWALLLTEGLKAARTAIEAEAAVRQVETRTLATTLILALATPETIAVAQIGDGAAVAGDREGAVISLTVPQRGEYADETVFLTSPGALDAAQVVVWRGTPAQLALFSDGLQRLALKMPEGIPHPPFFSPLFRFAANASHAAEAQAQLAAFLRSSRVRERTDDDLTILLTTLSTG